MSEIVPVGWKVEPLSDHASRVRSKNDIGNTNVLTASAIDGLINQREYFNKSVASSDISHYTLLRRGDFAYNKSYSHGYPVGVVRRLERYDLGVLSPLYICFSLDSDECDETYLSYYFDSYRFERELNSVVQEGARAHGLLNIPVNDFFDRELLLPPLPEQKKIASILTAVDEVIENTQKQIDKLQDLKKATMNELLTKGIGHTEFKDSELGRIPKSWEVVSLDKVCKVRQGLQIPIRDRFKGAATGRYPYLTVSWINSKFDSDKAEFIANPNDSVVLKSNEFLVGRTGAVGQIFDGLECVFHNNFFAVSLLTDSVEKEFLKHFLKWHTTQDLLLKLAGSTTIPDLNHGDFYSINVGLPPVEEQCRVVSQVDSIDTTLREIRLKLNALMSLKKSLMQDLLTGKVRVSVH